MNKNEDEMRLNVHKLEERRAKELKAAEEEARLKELDLKKLNQNQTRDEPINISQRLRKGDFTFDSQGKAMLVKRKNPGNLPDITPEVDISIKGQSHPLVSGKDLKAS